MAVIEYAELRWERGIERALARSRWLQVVLASLLGVIPGCIDAFLVFSLYSYGLVGFGALAAVLLSTAGDEAFVMLALIPEATPAIFGACLTAGVVGGVVADALDRRVGLRFSKPLRVSSHKELELELGHFVREHVWGHIVKGHIWKLFLWLFFTMLAISVLMERVDVGPLIPENRLLLLAIATLVGMIPESGPHLVFVLLFRERLVPLSVLVANTIVQDGHGSLPLLSYSVRDTIVVSLYTGLVGFLAGLLLIAAGL